MNKKGISIIIAITAVLGLICAIKFVPVGITILNLVMFTAGFAAGYLFNKKQI